ncbi:unnamed protein product [Durusdinium trenchii]|uniref:Uncharacterized protein n=1 Tax=Durusdinium trenchii TaxID=1381693 RepID=A0ABP0L2M5_9DINO
MNLYHDRAGSVRVTLATPTPRGLALALSNGQWELNSFRAHWSGRSLGYSGRRAWPKSRRGERKHGRGSICTKSTCPGPELTPEQEEALKKIQAAQRGLELRKADAETAETAETKLTPQLPTAPPPGEENARGLRRRQKRQLLRKARMYRLSYDFQKKKLIDPLT